MFSTADKLFGTVVATNRLSIPVGINLNDPLARTLIPTTGSLSYESKDNLVYYGDSSDWYVLSGKTGPTGQIGQTGPTGQIGSTGSPGYSSIGIETIVTRNGITTQPFTKVGTDLIWSSNGGTNLAPNFGITTIIWAPFGSVTSYILITPGALNVPDFFVCSKNIRTLRFYTEIQISVATTSRWRTNIFLNGVNSGTGNYWGSPSNNIANQRVFGVLELGGIAAGTQISVKIDSNTLPVSVQNNSSYFVIEYEI